MRTFVLLSLVLGIAAYAAPEKSKSGGCGDDCVFDDDCDAGLCGACDLGICGPSKVKSAIKELAAIKAAATPAHNAVAPPLNRTFQMHSRGCGDSCDYDDDCDQMACVHCTLYFCV